MSSAARDVTRDDEAKVLIAGEVDEYGCQGIDAGFDTLKECAMLLDEDRVRWAGVDDGTGVDVGMRTRKPEVPAVGSTVEGAPCCGE